MGIRIILSELFLYRGGYGVWRICLVLTCMKLSGDENRDWDCDYSGWEAHHGVISDNSGVWRNRMLFSQADEDSNNHSFG
jgi:hypothetical protein